MNMLTRILALARENQGEEVGTGTIKLGSVSARFFHLNNLSRKRWLRGLDKEPETIAWLDELTPDDVLWDIGANVGLYSIYAAMTRGCRVVAFEPGAGSYFTLNRNIDLNDMQHQVTAYCVSLSDANRVSILYMPSTKAGGSLASFGVPSIHMAPAFEQGSVAYRIDDIAGALPFPTRIKLDVDGNEVAILRGATSTLADTRLTSLIVELQEDEIAAASDILSPLGFRRDTSTARTAKQHSNVIFRR